MHSSVKYRIEKQSPLKQYIFDFLFNIIGVQTQRCDSDSNHNQIDIYYGNNPSVNCKVIILENALDVIWKQLIEKKISKNDTDRVVKFDVISAISSLITDEVNRNLPDSAYDTHERLIFSRSFQSKANIANVPIINLYVNSFRELLERKLSIKGIPLWPKAKKCAIGLSHDVDVPDRYAILRPPLICRNKDLKWHLVTNLKRAKAVIEYATGRGPDDFWLFEDVMQEEAKYGFNSTFFFAAVSQFDDWGSISDVAYNIQDLKFAKTFKNITSRGFEIGLHASYNAYHNENYLRNEKEKLEKIAGVEIVGLRHHRWHIGKEQFKTLRMHEKAGLEYDSSIAFNDHIGFRRSVALPYYPWDEVDRRMINVIQLPVFCMDGNLFYNQTENHDAIGKLKNYVNIIKQSGGLGVVDWHVRTSFPKNSKYLKWGKAYIEFLDFLSHDDDIWVTNLGEINSWLRERSKLVSQLDIQ